MVPEFADRQQISRSVKQNESFLRRWIGLATIQHIDIDAFTAQYFKEPEMWSSSLLLCLLLQNGTTPLVQDLLARIEALEKRVAELEQEKQPAPAAPTPAAAQQAATPQVPPPSVGAHQGGAAAVPQDAGLPEYPSLHINGFTDVNFSASDQRGTHTGFNEGQFTLHFVSALSPKVNFFGEVSLTARPDAGLGLPAAPGFNAEVERSIVRFDQSDRFKVSFGRYHTPINWWNTAYHHGQWLQTTVSRPEMIQFGGSFLPVHFVGALVEGSVPAGSLNLNYNVGLGNGRSSALSRAGDAGDVDNNRAWLANLSVRPDKLYGLQIGGAVYHDKLNLTSGQNFKEWISSGHIVWNRENPEIIAEFSNVTHKDYSGILATANSQAFYVQSAYRLPFNAKVWKPYYRYEYIHIPSSDVPFRNVPNLTNLSGSVVGMRYDLSEFAALKFEYRRQRRAPGEPSVNVGFLQTSFTF
jgi:hypothetical protein